MATGAPSPLTHTWSLAVEEQFYLVWPLVVLAVMHLARPFTRGIRVLLALSLAGVVGSALEMALRYSPTVDTTRLYFGTDTHAQSVMVGAALACLLTMVQMRRGADGMAPEAGSRGARMAIVVLGLAGLAGLVALAWRMAGTDGFTYQGGILLSALASAAVLVAAVCARRDVVARGLSLRPLVWIGTVSYGAYLWHYPVSVFVGPNQTGFGGIGLLAVRFAITFAAAAASYYLVERPIMIGTFWRSLRAIGPATAALMTTVVVIVAATAAPATAAVEVRHYQAAPSAPAARPVSLVVLGDSLGETLGVALQSTAPAGSDVEDRALFGCGLAVGSWVSNDPPKPELAMFPACNEATPASEQWPALDAKAVAHTGPGDDVLFSAGTWEVQDILRNGEWTNITQASFQRYELAQLRLLVRIATAHGAHLILATLPATAVGASFHERPFPEDSSRRRQIYDGLLEKVASEHPHEVSVLGLGRILSPGGVYRQYLYRGAGTDVRRCAHPGLLARQPLHQQLERRRGRRLLQLDLPEDLAADPRVVHVRPRFVEGKLGVTVATALVAEPPADEAELRARPSATGRDRIAALDGLRAVGVLLIMGFHFGIGWLPGGFVGVDLFYVLSGYLITGLLVGEFSKRGSIKLSSFWLRRARRLLPALVIVLVVVTLLVRYDAAQGTYPDFRMGALSSLFYFSNWWQIAASGNYFVATGAPSPLTHTWSLAVEEQFYLVWPLVVLAVMHLARPFTRGIRVLLALSLAGVVGSALEMALRYSPTVDTTRLYFGTDTHAQSVMVGAALACLLTMVQMRRGADGMAPEAGSRGARMAIVVLGLAGLAGLVALAWRMAGTDGFTYQGGILLSALASAAVLVAAVCACRGRRGPGPLPASPGVDRHRFLRRLSLALPGLGLRGPEPDRVRRHRAPGGALRHHLRRRRGPLLPGRAAHHDRHFLAVTACHRTGNGRPNDHRRRHRGRHRGTGDGGRHRPSRLDGPRAQSARGPVARSAPTPSAF